MSGEYARPLTRLLFFLGVSLSMTYPLVFHLWEAVPNDLGDPLFVVWAVHWDMQKILSFDLLTFWQGNIFYPASYTLAYSEHFFAQALLGLPVYVLSGSPILTYNLLLLSSFVLSGWGMYLFVKALTGHEAPALISGLIFAFFPYRFTHLGHLQLLTLQWTPFAFLYLHRFLYHPSSRHLALFGFFYVFQVLSCAYYGLFLSLFVGLLGVFHFVAQRQLPDWAVCRKLLFFTIAVAFIISPFFYPYIYVKQLFGFSRSLEETIFFSADVMNYLCSPIVNTLWGEISQPFCKPEGQIYPGIIAFLLAMLGGIVSLTNAHTPADQKQMAGFALLMAGLAFVFSLGPQIHINGQAYMPGPYAFLRQYVPGFDGLRVPARFGAFFMLAVAILGGYGSREFLRRIKTVGLQRLFFFGLGTLLLLDYLSLPIPMPSVPGEGATRPVYRWLQQQPGQTPTLELPTVWPKNIEYVYFSSMHGKDLFNGYSGYEPSWYRSTQAVLEQFPSGESVRLLEEIGIRYVIVHFDQLAASDQERIRAALAQFRGRIHQVATFGATYVYQIVQTQQLTREAAEQKLWRRSLVFAGKDLPSFVGQLIEEPSSDQGVIRLAREGEVGIVTFGPYVVLPPGQYQARFFLRVSGRGQRKTAEIGHLDVATNAGQTQLAFLELGTAVSLEARNFQIVRLDFEVPLGPPEQRTIEARVSSTGRVAIGVEKIEIWPQE